MNWRDLELYGNSPAAWVMALGVLTGALIVVVLLRLLVRRRLAAHDERSLVPRFLLDVVDRTRLVLLFFPLLALALRSLDLPPRFDEVLRITAILTFLLQGALWLTGFADYWLVHYKASHRNDPAALTTITAVGFVARFALWAIILLVALDNLGFNVTALVTGLGIGGVAVALATQNILGDLFASLSIVIDKPFVIGDLIAVGEHSGTVEYIGLKTTRIRSVNGEQLVFGNGDLLKSVIRNLQRVVERRVVFRFAVDSAVEPDRLAAIPRLVESVVSAHPELRFERAVVQKITGAAIELEATTHVVASGRPYVDVQHEVYVELFRRLRQEGIPLARP